MFPARHRGRDRDRRGFERHIVKAEVQNDRATLSSDRFRGLRIYASLFTLLDPPACQILRTFSIAQRAESFQSPSGEPEGVSPSPPKSGRPCSRSFLAE